MLSPRLNRLGRPIQPQNLGRAFERTEHESDSAILQHMGGSFISASGQIEIGHLIGGKNAEGIQPFGREIDVPIFSHRRRRDKEHPLSGDEVHQLLRDAWICIGHSLLQIKSQTISRDHLPMQYRLCSVRRIS